MAPHADRYADQSVIPVPVETIAHTAGWQVVRESHADKRAICSGFVLNQDNYQVIGVNQRISPRRQRYAIAHSFAHGVMHLTKARPLIVCYSLLLAPADAGTATATPEEEADARDFAMTLLMPEPPVREHLDREAPHASSRDQLIERLATVFEVSSEAMGYRLLSLGVISA